ncbi:MAG: ABC transporter permease [Chitinophagaceae bacterium]|nr:ABC transporter permease [Oligoflexus sp.]
MDIAPQLALQSVLGNWRHSLATLASVALGFMAVASIHGYNVDSERLFNEIYVYRSMTGHVIVEAEQAGEDQIEIEGPTADRILSVTAEMKNEVKNVVRFLGISGIIAGPKSSFRYAGLGYDVTQGELTRGPNWAWNTPYGHPMKDSPFPQIVVGKGLAELLGCALTSREPKILPDGRYTDYGEPLACFDQTMQLTALTAKNKMNAWDAPIVGIVDAGFRDIDDRWVMMPLADAQVFANTKHVSSLGILLEDPDHAQAFIRDLKVKLGVQNPPLRITFWKDHESASVYRNMMGIMNLFEIFMLLIIAFVCVLSMINTMARNVTQRVHEIGTLRAIGYRHSFVVRMFAWEGFFLGLTGTIFGIVGIIIVSTLLDRAGILYSPAIFSQKVPLRIALTPGAYAWLGLFLASSAATTAALVTRIKIAKNISELLQPP